jgi:hypothetical protein
MSRRLRQSAFLLGAAALLVAATGLDWLPAVWLQPHEVWAAPDFNYLIPPMVTSGATDLQRHKFAEELENALVGKLLCRLADEEYFKCHPDQNTEVVELTEDITQSLDMRKLTLSVNNRTIRGGHKMKISEHGCQAKMALARCVSLAIGKFSSALESHRDNCHLPGKKCE